MVKFRGLAIGGVSRHSREIVWTVPNIKAPQRVIRINKRLVELSDLDGGCRQVVDVQTFDLVLPLGHDGWHVHPWYVRKSKRVLQPLCGLIDLRDSQDVVNVGNEGDSLWWN